MLATEKKPLNIQQSSMQSRDGLVSVKLINVTGSKMRSSGKMHTVSDDDEVPEGYQPVPLFSKSFGDDLAQALEQVDKVEEKSGENMISQVN